MWGATFPSQASIDGMVEAEQRSYDGWADLIRRGQDDGSIRRDLDPTALAVVLFGMMRGVAALLLTESRDEGHEPRPGDVRRLDRRRTRASRCRRISTTTLTRHTREMVLPVVALARAASRTARGGDRVAGVHGRLAVRRGPRPRTPDRRWATRPAVDGTTSTVVAAHDTAPTRWRLHAPLITE